MAQGFGLRAMIEEIANNRPPGSPVRRFLATPVGSWMINHQLLNMGILSGYSGATGSVGHRMS